MAESMTDDGIEPPIDSAAPSGSGRKKLILFVVAPLVLLLLIGGGLWATGLLGKLMGGGGQKEEAAHDEKKPESTKQAAYFDMPEMLVNLNAAGRKTNFLKLTVSLEIENPQDVPKLQAVMPRIVDNFQVYLRELRMEDLKGSGGMYRVREELLARVNTAIAPSKVEGVLFKEMLVQ